MFNSIILSALISGYSAELNVLSCCKYAIFNGREYERTGSMYVASREDGTEVPMYSSVGNNENGGNMISLNWENQDANEGVKLAWPVLHIQKTDEIDGIPTAILEEYAKSDNKLHSNGEMKCPNELIWNDGLEWKCDETRADACIDQFEGCPTSAYENKCQTLKKICCVTCKKYEEEVRANQTLAQAESSNGETAGISNSISISTGMGVESNPIDSNTGPSRTATVTGGEWADITTTAIDENEEDETETISNSTESGTDEEVSPEPESTPGSTFFISISIPLLLALLWN